MSALVGGEFFWDKYFSCTLVGGELVGISTLVGGEFFWDKYFSWWGISWDKYFSRWGIFLG